MQWFQQEKTVLQLTSLLISTFIQRKSFRLYSFNLSSFFQQRTTMRGPSYCQKYEKLLESNIHYTKFRNSSAMAQAMTEEKSHILDWTESHNYHKHLIKYQKPLMLIIRDSIAKGLGRYMDLWDRYFGKHTVTFDNRGEKVEDVVSRIRNLHANKEVKYFVLVCGINNIDKNVPEDILKGTKYAIQLIKCK